ncbi:tape measure protein [Corynebacterium variabile]|uniref:aggregation-promoting factor C-terminal-like domain-containing protein n=1 Tax=Corynebacterium variabile TaxID=1727 RepID=UPI003FCF704E
MAQNGTEIGVGYISIVPSTDAIAPGIKKALGSSDIAKAGDSIGKKLGDNIKKSLKLSAAAAGTAAAGVIGTALTKGFNRLNAMDQAAAKFKGLKLSAAESAEVIENIGTAVKGTAFATSDAADASAMFLAAGIKPGKELSGVLTTVADTASFAGKEFGEVASIFTKAKNSGKVMGDTLAQLGDNGIPAVSALSKELGISAEEVTNLASKGQISFDDLQRAMDSTLGGSAKNAGETFSGAMDNVGAALGRVGETLLSGAFSKAPAFLGGVIDKIDVVNDRIKGAMTLLSTGDFTGDVGEQLGGVEEDSAVVGALLTIREHAVVAGDAMQDFGAKAADAFRVGISGDADQATLISPEMAQSIETFHDLVIDRFGSIRDNISKVFDSVDFSALGGALGSIAQALGGISAQISAASWEAIAGVINAVTPILRDVLVPVLNDIAGFVQDNPGLVQAMVTAWLGFKTAGMATKGVGTVISGIKGKVTATKTAISELKSGAGLAWDVLKEAKSTEGPIVGVTKAITSSGTAAKIATGAQKVFSGALSLIVGHPVIAAIAAIVGALVLFFTKTELGKQIWQAFVDFLGTAFEWVKGVAMSVWPYISQAIQTVGDVIQAVWTGFIKPVLDFMSQAFQIVGGVIFAVIYGTILVAWNALSALIQAAWSTIIQPCWAAMQVGLQTLGSFFSWVWNSLIAPAWNALGAGIRLVYDTIIKPCWDALTAALRAVGDFFTWWWNNVTKPAWDAFGNGIRFVYDTIIKPCWDALKAALQAVGDFFKMIWNSVIKPAWDALGSGIEAVRVNIVDPAFNKIKTALSSVGDFFRTIVDKIRSVWNGLKSALAKPINFMIRTVWNNGILKAWNTAAGFLPGLKKGDPLTEIQENATGGDIRGAGTGTSDSILSWLSNGEHVVTADEVKMAGGQSSIYAIRKMIASGTQFTWDNGKLFTDGQATDNNGPLHRVLPAFKDGGDVEPAWKQQLAAGHKWAQSVSGRPYLTGSQWDAGGDCSGYMSAIASVIGGAAPNSGHWATPAFPASQSARVVAAGQTWLSGKDNGFSIGMTGGPQSGGAMGHTAGTLGPTGSFGATNVESGGSHGDVRYGGPAAGADSSQWTSGNYRLAIGADGAFETGGGPSPAQQKSGLRKKVEEIVTKAIQPALDAMPHRPPEWLEIPSEALKKFKDGALDKLFDIIENLGELLSGAWNKAKDFGSKAWDSVTGLFRDQGGPLPTGMSIVRNETGKPEAVLNWDQLGQVKGLAEAASKLVGPAGGDFVNAGIAQAEMYANAAGNLNRVFGEVQGGDFSSLSGDTGDGKGVIRWDLMGSQIMGDAASEFGDEIAGLFGIKSADIATVKLVDENGKSVKQATAKTSGTPDIEVPAAEVSVVPDGVEVSPSVTAPDPTAGTETTPGYSAPGTREITDAERAEYAPVAADGSDIDVSGITGDTKSIVKQIFAKKGWTGSQWTDADFIITRESGWDPTATNPSSGAYGLFQFLGATKQTYLPGPDYSVPTQGKAGARYITDRYGDPHGAAAFWRANNWYDQGGIASGVGHMLKNTNLPERVLSPTQTKAFEQLVTMLPSLVGTGITAGAGALSAAFPQFAPLIAAATPLVSGAASGFASTAGAAVTSGLDSLADSLSEAKADAAAQPITAGAGDAITINISGGDPKQIAAEVQRVLRNPRRASGQLTTV